MLYFSHTKAHFPGKGNGGGPFLRVFFPLLPLADVFILFIAPAGCCCFFSVVKSNNFARDGEEKEKEGEEKNGPLPF